jgi:phosphate:Na+ symporter
MDGEGMEILQTVLQLAGGLAIFIFGVDLLSEGLEKAAGKRLLTFLEKAAGNRIKGMLFGTVAVSLLQSSSMLMVTMIGLINARMLTLQQAIGVMLGSEIGTTITGQIVAFDLKSADLVFLVIGFILLFFVKDKKWQTIGQPFFGIGLVFMGMKMMSAAGQVLSQLPAFGMLIESMSHNVILGVAVGAVLTALIQSSSAMTGLVIAMGNAEIISLVPALALIMGANIGTCFTGWLASLKSSLNAKRASYAQIFINFGGVILFLPFIRPFAALISSTSSVLPRQIANAHTVFNVVVSVILLPFVNPITKLVRNFVRGSGEKKVKKVTKYIDEQFFSSPYVAVSIAREEVLRMGWLTLQMVKNAEKSFLLGKTKHATAVLEKEPDIDQISHLVTDFIENIPSEKLNQEERAMLGKLYHLVTDIERVGDHAVNLAEFAIRMEKKGIKFTKYARKELEALFKNVREHYGISLKAFTKNDQKLMDQVVASEDEVDGMEKRFKKNHVKRLREGLCQPEADPIYVETLRNLERISDHSYNIALSLIY